MNIHEARLRAMLAPNSSARWGLNLADKDAIEWALDAIDKLKAERDYIRKEYSDWLHADTVRRQKVAAVVNQLVEATR